MTGVTALDAKIDGRHYDAVGRDEPKDRGHVKDYKSRHAEWHNEIAGSCQKSALWVDVKRHYGIHVQWYNYIPATFC